MEIKDEIKEYIEKLDSVLQEEYSSVSQLLTDIRDIENISLTYSNQYKFWYLTLVGKDGSWIPHTARCFRELEDGRLVSIDIKMIREKLIEQLAEYIDPKEVIEEVLKGIAIEDIFEIKERIKEEVVVSRGGCLSLNIGKNKPFELHICGKIEEG